MTRHVATVCVSCPAGREGLAQALRAALAQEGIAMETAEIDCMSGCRRGSTVGFRAAGKTAYLFGELTAADLPELIGFARAYLAAPRGDFVDARPLGALRFKALARIPPEGA